MRLCVLVLLCSSPTWGQFLLEAGSRQYKEVEKFFRESDAAKPTKEERLSCNITPLPARLSYSFQYWSGFDITLPVVQFANRERRGATIIVTRVKSLDVTGPEAYLYSQAALPRKMPEKMWTMKNVEIQLGGGFLVGPGKYEVTTKMVDRDGRTCAKSWKVTARREDIPAQLAVGEIRGAGLDDWKGLSGGNGVASIYLHAAPIFRRRNITRLTAWDREVLLNSLRSVLDNGGFAKVRLKAFDFDGRRVVFESEDFKPADYEQLVGALMNLNLGMVSLDTLKGPNEEQFLTHLMRDEADQKQAADAVIFLGPSWRWGAKVSPLLREIRGQLSRVFYVSLTPWFSSATDLIERFVGAGPRGKTMTIFQPVDLAKAIREIRERRN
jgi:hypothetical protein